VGVVNLIVLACVFTTTTTTKMHPTEQIMATPIEILTVLYKKLITR